MSEKKKQDDTSLYMIAAIVAGIIGISIWEKMKPSLWRWYFDHRLQIAGFISIIVVWVSYWTFKTVRLKIFTRHEENKITNGKDGDSVFAGFDDSGNEIFINLAFRTMHAQVVGTTNAGKTESVIIPWCVDDMKKKRGFVLIDGKADRTLLNKLYAYAKKHGRENDFRIFSLSDTSLSHSYNPLIDGTPAEITERVFGALEFEDPYYKNIQFDVLKNTLAVFDKAQEVPTFFKIVQVLKDSQLLLGLAKRGQDPDLIAWALGFSQLQPTNRELRISGLVSQLDHFTTSEFTSLFNQEEPSISIRQAMAEGKIIYFQLPVLRAPFLGKATAKLVLQDLQYEISERHLSGENQNNFFSIYLDDFTEYLTKGFLSTLNKSRSANVGVTFAHQALGDLDSLEEGAKNIILTNSNLKVFMRANEPDSAEYFAKVIGTNETKKLTERVDKSIIGNRATGAASSREAEEFIVHPNIFKKSLGVGEALLVLPHQRGSKTVRIKFEILPNLPTRRIPSVIKLAPADLPKIELISLATDDGKKKPTKTAQILNGLQYEKDPTLDEEVHL